MSFRVDEAVLKEIQSAVENLRYGSVEIIVHDSKIVQIEKKEKLRFQINPADRTTGGHSSQEKVK